MPELLANPPWYIPVLLGVVALILLYQGNNLQRKPMKLAGLACALAGMLVVVLGNWLESDREIVARKTRELAASVDARDWRAFGALLDPEVRFFVYAGRDQFVSGAQKSAEALGVKNITLGNFEVNSETGAYRVDFTAHADLDGFPYRSPTNWRFFWSKSPQTDEFLLYDIKFVPSEQINENAVFSRLLKP